jgi:hypothetical protein
VSVRGEILSCEGNTYFGWRWGKRNGSDFLTASEERLIVGSRLGKINLRAETVLRVERAGIFPWLRGGVVIRHRSEGYPSGIGFIPISHSSEDLLEMLGACGYSVVR